MILRYFSKCRHCCHSTTATNTGINGSNNNHHHYRPWQTPSTLMERVVDKFSDILELIVYWIGPLLILLALSIVILLCYTFLFILLPMIYQKHSVTPATTTATTSQLVSESLYFFDILFQQPRAFLVMTFHCTIVLILVTNVLYNYACCVLQSHVGVHYDHVIQELANITHTILPTTPQELLSYRRHLSDQLTQRMKEQQHQQRTTVRSTINESNIHHANNNELTQRRTTTTTTSDDPSSTTFSDSSNNNLSSTNTSTMMQPHPQKSAATTTSSSVTHTQPTPPQQQQQQTSSGSSQSTSTTTTTPTPPIRAWMLLGPYEWGYCSQSNQPKPPRSHYDHVSKQLILNLDHYCPWMFNAVGYFNYRYFVNFLIFTFIGMVYGACIMLEPFLLLRTINYRNQNTQLQQRLAMQQIKGTVVLSHQTFHGLQPRIQPMMPFRDEKVYLTLSFMLCVAVSVALIGLGGFHIYLVSTGQTTIEFHGNWALRRRYEQIVTMVTYSANGTKKKKNKWQNPYSRGSILANWQQVYGVSTVPFLKWIGCGCSDRSYINLLFCVLIPHRRLPEYLPVPIPGQTTLRSMLTAENTATSSSHIECNGGGGEGSADCSSKIQQGDELV